MILPLRCILTENVIFTPIGINDMDAQYDYVYGVYFGADSDKVFLGRFLLQSRLTVV
jgi:hypothetical protein